MKGRVFDIRRFSTHDGSGIRTTAFLKGCPLCCAWCQNPEGILAQRRPVHFPNKCIRCGTCLKYAGHGGVFWEDGAIHLRSGQEEDWDEIADACPTGAIAMDCREYEAKELAEELCRDQVFFRENGGVTLSGGEPLMQGEFAAEVLKRLKEKGIHTAVETALHIPAETLGNVLPYIDLVYADLKIADEEMHRRHVGVSNRLIKQNLEYILTSRHREKAIIRTPLIPGYTATEENLSAIASFLSGLYPQARYELLNYNPLAEAKYHLVGKAYCFQENPKMYTKAQMEAFGKTVKKYGIENLIIE